MSVGGLIETCRQDKGQLDNNIKTRDRSSSLMSIPAKDFGRINADQSLGH